MGAERPARRQIDEGGPLVLVATDGSDDALEAADVAARIFPDGVQFEVVTVLPRVESADDDATGFASPVLDDEQVRALETERRVEADGTTARTARRLGSVPVRHHVLRGDTVDALHRLVRDRHPDVIVVGSHRSTLAAALMGSTSDAVVRDAMCPVLVVPSRARRVAARLAEGAAG